jgi:hypothetical protein
MPFDSGGILYLTAEDIIEVFAAVVDVPVA